MADTIIKVYADTSVYGGVFDQRFEKPSRAFLEEVRTGRFQLHSSPLIYEELAPAPAEVRLVFEEMADLATVIEITQEALLLRTAYLDAGILTSKSAEDALHVALASIFGCSLVVSWNFRHIVHFQKIPRYNAINTLRGYAALAIYSPLEVLNYEERIV